MNYRIKGKNISLSPTQILALGFATVILLGSILLNLPAASRHGESMGYINALFQATSAVCVTGLVVVDTATDLSLFGQIVILILIQIGGLGFMSMATMIFLLLGKRITLRERLIMQEALNQFTLEGIVRLSRNIVMATFIVEGIGAVLLSFRFIPLFGWARGIYYSIFHSISAFCNAGFDLMGNYKSFTGFTDDILVNFTLMGLIIIGGLGFSVMLDLYHHKGSFKKWALHTKVVVLVSAGLIAFGFLFFLIVEFNNPDTLGMQTPVGKFLGALFQSVTTRTAGFNTINTAALTDASKFMVIILMFIGASPASTGGGIKTATASMILLSVLSVIKGREEVDIFRRRIPRSLVKRAYAIVLISVTVLIAVTMGLSLLEYDPFIDTMFQVGSALGTVGLSTIDTGAMGQISKLLIIITMFMGRVGPLTLTLALARRQTRTKADIKYPEDRIMVG